MTLKVTLKNIHHQFAEHVVLKDINLEIPDGHFFTLLGPSGCGKTTLLRIIAGFINPTSGSVLLGSQDITHLPPEKRNIGTVFQNYALFPNMNVEDNIAYGLKLKKMNKKEIEERVHYYLNLVSLDHCLKRKVTELSGGQQQRVALARSLAIEPKILLLDEPMSNLDASLREKTREEIYTLQQKLKITTLFITHDQKEAISISDKIAILNEGKCLQLGTPHDVYNNPIDAFSANFIGESNVFTIEECRNFEIDLGDAQKNTHFIRPERIRIYESCMNDTNAEGEVIKVLFNGSTISYEVISHGKILKVLDLNGGQSVTEKKVGQKVFITFE